MNMEVTCETGPPAYDVDDVMAIKPNFLPSMGFHVF